MLGKDELISRAISPKAPNVRGCASVPPQTKCEWFRLHFQPRCDVRSNRGEFKKTESFTNNDLSDLIIIDFRKRLLNCILMVDLKGFLALATLLFLLLSPTQHKEEDNWSIMLIEQSGQPEHRSRCANLHSLRQTGGLNHAACCDWQHKQFCFVLSKHKAHGVPSLTLLSA